LTLKAVVIGTGFGQHTAAPAYEAAGCKVELVSPRDTDAVRAAVEAPCDIVSVHSPPFMHLEHVRLAAENRRAILCDKPFGRDADEARQMVELADKAGVLNFLNFEFRRDPLRLKLKSLIESGAIGAPQHVSWTALMDRGRSRRHGWLFEKDKGGGWIGAYGSHVVDALRWIFGEAVEVSGHLRTEVKERRDRERPTELSHPSTAEDAFTAWLRMESGVSVAIDTAFAAAVSTPERLVFFGDQGALQVSGGKELVLIKPDREPERFTFREGESDPHKPGIDLWIAEICKAVTEGRQLAPDFREGLACAKVLDRLRAR
jgi:predicted dehydrogenase